MGGCWRAGGRSLGAIELSSVPLSDPPAQAVSDAIREAVASEGIALLAWTEAATALRARLDFLHRALGDPWPDVSDAALTQHLDSWLGPQLARVRSAEDLRRIDVTAALRALVPWPEAGRLDEVAPERVEVPSGSSVRIDYSQDQPVLAVRLQEVFGWTAAPRPRRRQGPAPAAPALPARRPAAVTADLESFWDNGYPGVRADLRGRYPKHAWPRIPAARRHRTDEQGPPELSARPVPVVGPGTIASLAERLGSHTQACSTPCEIDCSPSTQRRTADELDDDLDLRSGTPAPSSRRSG